MQRILVAGIPGSGKTTLGRLLAQRLELQHIELDALHHGPGWVKRDEFEHEVGTFASTDRWVTEDQYHRFLGDMLWQRADTVLWLDFPHWLVMTRVIRRSVRRAITREELWNGNRENWRDWLSAEHPIRWAWSNFERRRRETAERIETHPHVTVVRFPSRRALERWLRHADVGGG